MFERVFRRRFRPPQDEFWKGMGKSINPMGAYQHD